MRLNDWMKEQGLDFTGLVIRIHQRTGHQITAQGLQRIATKGGCLVESAKAIMEATDGKVTLDDLLPAATKANGEQEANGSSGA